MQWRNHTAGYGLVAILFHWSMALLIVGLFALGKWMVSLDYYHPWYNRAPDLHRSLGVITGLLLLLRLGWRLANPRPRLAGVRWERRAALAVHRLFYLLTAAVVVAGYLITTADGQPVVVFGRWQLPALLYGLQQQADVAGRIHDWLATALIGLAILHTLAALKHHVVDRDDTLRRMLRPLAPSRSAIPGANNTHQTKQLEE